jgi:hypothetical protein
MVLDRNLTCTLQLHDSEEAIAARRLAALSSTATSVRGSPPQSPFSRSLVSAHSASFRAASASVSLSSSPTLGALHAGGGGDMGGFSLGGARSDSPTRAATPAVAKPASNIQYMRAAQPFSSQNAALRSGANGGGGMITHPVSASGAATVAVIHGFSGNSGSRLPSQQSASMVHSHTQSRSLTAVSAQLTAPPSRLATQRPSGGGDEYQQEVDVPGLLRLRDSWTLFLRVRAHVLCAEQVYQLPDGEDLMRRCFFAPPAMALPDHAPAGRFEAFEKEAHREEALLLDVMAQLLQDCIHQPQVLAAFGALAAEPAPYFVYVPQQPLDDATAAFVHPHALDDVRVKCIDHGLRVPAAPALVDARTARPVPSRLDEPFQAWSETILDQCVFALLQEAVAGEFQPTAGVAVARAGRGMSSP